MGGPYKSQQFYLRGPFGVTPLILHYTSWYFTGTAFYCTGTAVLLHRDCNIPVWDCILLPMSCISSCLTSMYMLWPQYSTAPVLSFSCTWLSYIALALHSTTQELYQWSFELHVYVVTAGHTAALRQHSRRDFFSGRPNSMNMMCPYDIGRDSWEWEGQESVEWPDLNSPQELGEEALTEWTRNTVETERPLDESNCCCCCCCCFCWCVCVVFPCVVLLFMLIWLCCACFPLFRCFPFRMFSCCASFVHLFLYVMLFYSVSFRVRVLVFCLFYVCFFVFSCSLLLFSKYIHYIYIPYWSGAAL